MATWHVQYLNPEEGGGNMQPLEKCLNREDYTVTDGNSNLSLIAVSQSQNNVLPQLNFTIGLILYVKNDLGFLMSSVRM